jgi:undecaprenyl phosphate N,N'-diacetylbacillosamine 1-phosphate transferase
MYALFIKRSLDFIAALLIIIILSPLILLVIMLLFFTNNRKVFFTQERPGKNSKIFSVIKFKTMNDRRDINGNLLPDKDRLTSIGKFIRTTSIDELPQLFNVLKGDMSLVGPRPLLVHYLPLYNETQARRHLVRPGITGWAQVNGRNTVSWDEKFALDVWYVEHQSFFLDVKILWLTIIKIIKRDDINAANAATMHPFTGS